jgi:GDP-L-fucose synthase
MMRKIYLAKLINEGAWDKIAVDLDKRPVEGVNGSSSRDDIIAVLDKYGISDNKVVLWGTGTPLREFLWSEDMADASVHVLLNVNFSDIIGIEKYSSVHYGASTDGAVDRNHSAGRGGAIPSLGEIRNCHINVGTGKEISIREVAERIMQEIGFKGELRWDATKPDGTMKKLTDVSKLHRLGWHHTIEIDEGIHRLYEWYLQGICINHKQG